VLCCVVRCDAGVALRDAMLHRLITVNVIQLHGRSSNEYVVTGLLREHLYEECVVCIKSRPFIVFLCVICHCVYPYPELVVRFSTVAVTVYKTLHCALHTSPVAVNALQASLL
jgi:hypothetical protein